MNFSPGLSLRASEEDEIMGIDDAEIGEFAVSPALKDNRMSYKGDKPLTRCIV